MEDLSNIVSRVANADYGHSRHTMPAQPWWDNLESNFHRFPDDFELDLRTKLLVDATAYADIGIRTVVASLLAGLSMPLMFNPLRKFKDQEEIQFYQAMAETADTNAFFKRPPGGVEIRETEPAWDHWDRCQIHWFPGNHVVHLDQGKYLKEMLAFMQGIDFR